MGYLGDIYILLCWLTIALMFATGLESAFMKFGVEGKNQAPTEDKQENNNERHVESIDELRRKHGIKSSQEAKEQRESRNGGI